MTEQTKPTAEDIARHYSACMDSVNLINGAKPAGIDQDEWNDALKRNKDHLAIMLAKDFWTDEDLKPLRDAIA